MQQPHVKIQKKTLPIHLWRGFAWFEVNGVSDIRQSTNFILVIQYSTDHLLKSQLK